MSVDVCPLCQHPLANHGEGCCTGWLELGPECHCPNDWNGRPAVICQHIDCAAIAEYVDLGTFACAEHADPRFACTFDTVPTWLGG